MRQLTGYGVLLRHFLRRDLLMVAAWTAGIALLYVSQAISVDGLYATQAEFDKAAAAMEKNASFIAMAGPARALNTIGGQVTWQASAFGAVCAGLMSMFLIGRHTRAEEETGREELVRAAAVGRRAPQTAALSVALLANLVVGLAVFFSLWSYGLPLLGSIASGLQVGLTGAAFAGSALLVAQLTPGARAMYGLTGLLLGLAYALRAVGDVSNGLLSWLSPIGWGQAMHAYSGESWWPALLLAGATVLTVAASYAVFEHRDVGSGVFPDRPGPDRASPRLLSAFGLAWRLQRGSVFGWAAALFAFGLAYGTIGNDVSSLLGDSETTKKILDIVGDDLVKGFFAAALLMLALIGTAFAVSSALRPNGEEVAGRLEGLLATGLSRSRWFAAHGAVTVVGVVVMVVVSGLGIGFGYAAATGEWSAPRTYVVASLQLLAPVLLVAAVARLLYAVSSGLARWAWLPLGFSLVVMYFGQVLNFPDWLMSVSPYTHLAPMPVEDFNAAPFVTLVALTVLVAAAGQWLFTRRDVH